MAMKSWHQVCLLSSLLSMSGVCWSAERILTIGGGYSPDSNQVSLEKNVELFQHALSVLGLNESPHHLLFSDGTDPAPDLQVQETTSCTVRDLAAILGNDDSTDGIGERYRSHHLQGVSGDVSLANINAWFTAQTSWRTDERALLYFTCHGELVDKKAPRKSQLCLWGDEVFTVADLAKRLDTLPSDVPVTLVMTQCYSGGFADAIFANGDATGALADQPRCGFFSTTPERMAAGCTSDIKGDDYREYSTYFWEALSGETRQCYKFERPDYDHDGYISLAEAHAYVIIHDSTIDVPVKTSDVFLQRFSRLDHVSDEALSLDQPFSTLLAVADPIARAVLEGLSQDLALSGEDRVSVARVRELALRSERKELGDRITEAVKEHHQQRETEREILAKALKKNWPELANPFHPKIHELLAEDSDPIGTFLRQHEALERFHKAQERFDALGEEYLDKYRQNAKFLRFIRAAQFVVLEGNLPFLADAEICARYTKLLSLENRPVGSHG